jgi:hypothetical protein
MNRGQGPLGHGEREARHLGTALLAQGGAVILNGLGHMARQPPCQGQGGYMTLSDSRSMTFGQNHFLRSPS